MIDSPVSIKMMLVDTDDGQSGEGRVVTSTTVSIATCIACIAGTDGSLYEHTLMAACVPVGSPCLRPQTSEK